MLRARWGEGGGGWEKGSEDESKAGFCVTIGAMIDKRTTRDLVTLDLTPSHKTIAKITIVDGFRQFSVFSLLTKILVAAIAFLFLRSNAALMHTCEFEVTVYNEHLKAGFIRREGIYSILPID